MAQLKDTTINGGLAVSGKIIVGSSELNVENEITALKNVMSSTEHKTAETFFGKPVYTKSFKFSTSVSANTPYSLAHGLSNIGYIWIDMQNSFMFTSNNSLCVPVVSSMCGGSTGTGNNWTCSVNSSSIYIYADGGWNTAWEKCITIRYTKTTD